MKIVITLIGSHQKKKKKVLNKVTDEKIEVPACKCITIFI